MIKQVGKKVEMYLRIEGKKLNDFNIKVKDLYDGQIYFTDGVKNSLTDCFLCITEDGQNFDWLMEEHFTK